ncbi:hypothetical protein DFJ74DRAFT_75267 [Hyaloraphidium curvatum]|nr:hypothetical protein DFJ74DRAFT_75267 [Hyaloraphidium curvatum]
MMASIHSPAITKKVVLITGAASGFGRRLAEKVAARGPRALVLADIDGAAGEEFAGELKGKGVNARFVKVDLAEMDQVKAMVVGVLKNEGGIDVLVNNAGYGDSTFNRAVERGDVDFPPDRWIKMTQVNYFALVYATQIACAAARKSDRPLVVVSTASMAGILPQPEPVYSSGKAAVIHFTRSLASLAPLVRAAAVCPNAAETGFMAASYDGDEMKGFAEAMKPNMVTVDSVSDALLRCIEETKLAGQIVRIVPRGTDVWDPRTGKTTPIDKFSGRL